LSEEFPLARRVPLSPFGKFLLQTIERDSSYVLSRFAYCRRDGDNLVVESPLAYGQIVLPDWKGAALIAELAKPQTIRELGDKIPGISEEVIELFLSLLLSSKMLGLVGEDESETLMQWEFHDLLFHSRTRTGRHGNPVGRTYPFLGKIEPLPAIKPRMSEDTISLYKPDIDKLKESDTPFTRVLEERETIRKCDRAEPITDRQLGEFLYRTARVKEVAQTEIEETSKRPYSNGGACYELELYAIINLCKHIPSGFYHYLPNEHLLCRLSDQNNKTETLLEEARLANRELGLPQVLIVISARFPRIAWNYESIAYATILKNVGALFQTMYIVATAMNLAPCAIGEGNSDMFAALVGTDYYAESSVGEFLLGSKLPD
jgi:SagB-type dehydrogenase family enzyme